MPAIVVQCLFGTQHCCPPPAAAAALHVAQLCHLAAVMTAQRSELVLYFDTTNAFSADRARQMIEFTEPEVRFVQGCVLTLRGAVVSGHTGSSLAS